jgi:hypothetical protein
MPAAGHADGQALRGQVDPVVLTDAQRDILALLGDQPARARVRVAEPQARSFNADAAFAVLGFTSILGGIVMLFFFAALGSVLLVAGAALCAVAFEHVSLSEMAQDELEDQMAVPPEGHDPRLS